MTAEISAPNCKYSPGCNQTPSCSINYRTFDGNNDTSKPTLSISGTTMTLTAPSTQATSILSVTKTIQVAMRDHPLVVPKDHTIEIDAHPFCNIVGQNISS
jgi:hypothetical protein